MCYGSGNMKFSKGKKIWLGVPLATHLATDLPVIGAVKLYKKKANQGLLFAYTVVKVADHDDMAIPPPHQLFVS